MFLQRRIQLGSLYKVSQSTVIALLQHVRIPSLGLLLVSLDLDPNRAQQVFPISWDWLLGVGVYGFYAPR